MNELYVCTKDYQGGTFGVGRVHTVEQWRNIAIIWAETDDNDEYADYLEDLRADRIIDEIKETWQLEIVPINDLLENVYITNTIFELLNYISDNAIALSYLRGYVEKQDEEYGELLKHILDLSSYIITEVERRGGINYVKRKYRFSYGILKI